MDAWLVISFDRGFGTDPISSWEARIFDDGRARVVVSLQDGDTRKEILALDPARVARIRDLVSVEVLDRAAAVTTIVDDASTLSLRSRAGSIVQEARAPLLEGLVLELLPEEDARAISDFTRMWRGIVALLPLSRGNEPLQP